jgi:hypothetical protein
MQMKKMKILLPTLQYCALSRYKPQGVIDFQCVDKTLMKAFCSWSYPLDCIRSLSYGLKHPLLNTILVKKNMSTIDLRITTLGQYTALKLLSWRCRI